MLNSCLTIFRYFPRKNLNKQFLFFAYIWFNDCSKFWFANQMGTFQVLNVFDCWYHWCCQLIGSLPWKIIKSTKECWIKFCILVTSSTKKEYAIKNKYIYLKCGFCKKLPLYECNSDQLPTFFILLSLLSGCNSKAKAIPHQKWWQNEKSGQQVRVAFVKK